ncbi:MAG: septum formation initiator family protein [Rhizobiaceae bacterium]|nr:septum formation initiator family protein [Rhizobiaceae bacterium]
MVLRRRKRRTLARFIAPLATLVIVGYFGFHAFNGQYGIRANLAMQTRMAELKIELAELTRRRDKFEERVKLLRAGTLEKDMVDQHVRAQLNMVREDEIVLFIHN